jgi:hypothetical protein
MRKSELECMPWQPNIISKAGAYRSGTPYCRPYLLILLGCKSLSGNIMAFVAAAPDTRKKSLKLLTPVRLRNVSFGEIEILSHFFYLNHVKFSSHKPFTVLVFFSITFFIVRKNKL